MGQNPVPLVNIKKSGVHPLQNGGIGYDSSYAPLPNGKPALANPTNWREKSILCSAYPMPQKTGRQNPPMDIQSGLLVVGPSPVFFAG